MDIQIYFSYSFVSVDSIMYKVNDDGENQNLDESSATTLAKLNKDGWRLAHAIKTAQSAQLDSFNFLLIFEK